MKRSMIAALALMLWFASGRIAAAQEPSPAPAALPGAGTIPATISLDVTGTQGVEADALNAMIRAALDREIRPMLRPATGIRYGPIVPWPLVPVPAGSRAAVGVTVTLSGDATSAPVSGVTTVVLNHVAIPPVTPLLLFLSDDPEYLPGEGLVFRGDVAPFVPARLYYYHSDLGLPRAVDVVLTARARTRAQLIASAGGPELDVMNVGHTVSRDFLRYEQRNEGTIVDVVPGRPFVVHHAIVLNGEVVAGAVDVRVLGPEPVRVSVVAALVGSSPETYLDGPRLPYDGHNRHGIFDLGGFGDFGTSFAVGGADVGVRYGGRDATPRNVDPKDPGRDYGSYGVVHRITLALKNPTDVPTNVYLYEKPIGGPVRSTFYVDGRPKELGCVRLPQAYWVSTYQLPPHTDNASTTITMPDGGSFYPLEFGVTATPPTPYTPRVGTPGGCSPNVTTAALP